VKKILLISVSAALLLLTGCSQKTPEVDMTKKEQPQVQKSEPVTTNTNTTQTVDENNDNDISYRIAQLEQKVKIIHFDFDKYNIREDQKPLVNEDASLINSDEAKDFSVKLEGNCDEWGSDEYNYALGLKRAKSVKTALTALGVNPGRLMIISYGKSNPVCEEHTKACWAKNRRVEFKFLP